MTSDQTANAWPNTDEQCTCGHAADRHGLDAICNEDCPCTGYESWVTAEMALANARRISGDNADLAMKARSQFAVAQERIVRVEAVIERWQMRSLELRKSSIRNTNDHSLANSYDDLRFEMKAALNGPSFCKCRCYAFNGTSGQQPCPNPPAPPSKLCADCKREVYDGNIAHGVARKYREESA